MTFRQAKSSDFEQKIGLFFMDAETFWKNVSQVMKSKKISQEKMCEDIGISIWTLRSSISKQILPRVDVAKTIADYLGTSVDFLLTGKESNTYKQRLECLKKSIKDIIENEGDFNYFKIQDNTYLMSADPEAEYNKNK